MSLFRRKQKRDDKHVGATGVNASIEIVAGKEARAEAIHEAQQANEELNKLLSKNGFTMKIYLATGGHLPPEGKEKTT